MDPQMMQRILQRQGAPDTPQNQNSVSQFAAANPDVLDRYGMGLPPGLDDNSALLKLALDRSMAQVDGTPPGRVEVGQPTMAPQQASAPAPAPTQAPQRPMGPANRTADYSYPQPGVRPGASEPLPGVNPIDIQGKGPPTRTAAIQAGGGSTGFQSGPNLGGTGVSPVATPQMPAGSGASGEQSGSLMDWLLPALGLGGVGAAAYANRPRPAPAPQSVQQQLSLPAPQRQLPAPAPPPEAPPMAMPDQSGPGGRPGQSPADVERLRAEVDAEREQGARALQDQLRRQNAQRETGDLVKRAGRAVGRK